MTEILFLVGFMLTSIGVLGLWFDGLPHRAKRREFAKVERAIYDAACKE